MSTARSTAALMLCLGVLAGLASGSLPAQTAARAQACIEERDVAPGLMSEAAYNRMSSAFELIGEEAYPQALERFRDLAASSLSDFERATVEQALGFLASQREDYRAAIAHFREAIRLDRLRNQAHFSMILQVAQLHNALEEYDEALEQLDFWFCVSDEDARKVAEVWVLKASLHLQMEDYEQSLAAINAAIRLADEAEESWYRLKLGVVMELDRFAEAVEVLKILVGLDPDRKEYWVQLSGAYSELGDNTEAMAALRLAYRRGLLDQGSEYMQLAGLLQEMDSPRQAGEVMQEGIENGYIEATARSWEMTAGAWYQARELDRALAAFEAAGALSDSGKIDLQRASILSAEEDWDGVQDAAVRALRKGGLSERQEGNAHVLMGIAYFRLGRYEQAEQVFNKASNYGTLREAAREWLKHIAQTRERTASR